MDKVRQDTKEARVDVALPHSQVTSPEQKSHEGDKTHPVDISKLPKTVGEKYYDAIQFTLGKAWIMAFTAIIAYYARYGKDQYGPVPNVLKKFQTGVYDKLMHNQTFPLAEAGEFGKRFAGGTANTFLLFHGGNMFAPVMKWLENDREKIATFFNKRYGKPGDVELGHERLKDTPQQTWGDVVKGRLGAWGIVFVSFLSFDSIAGRDKKTGMYLFDKYEEWFARKVAGFSKAGKELAAVPLHQELTLAQDANKLYRFSKILALDFYATSAAIVIWNLISRKSARKRNDRNGVQYDVADIIEAGAASALAEPLPVQSTAEPEKKKNLFTDKLVIARNENEAAMGSLTAS